MTGRTTALLAYVLAGEDAEHRAPESRIRRIHAVNPMRGRDKGS